MNHSSLILESLILESLILESLNRWIPGSWDRWIRD
jgi:hypothetical protein